MLHTSNFVTFMSVKNIEEPIKNDNVLLYFYLLFIFTSSTLYGICIPF